MKDSYHILVVEDQINIWSDLTEFFQPEIDKGLFTLDFAATAKEGLKKVNTDFDRTDVVIIDVILPDTPSHNELYFIDSLKNKVQSTKNQLKGILVSAHKSMSALNAIASQNEWIVNSLVKPLKRKSLRQALEKTLDFSLTPTTYVDTNKEINEDLLQEFRQEAQIIKMKMKRSVQDILDAGKRLHAVKKKLPHGYFKNWIETELGCHYTTGVNLMRVAHVFGNNEEKIAQMGVAPSILYFLATPNTPKQAREKVIQLIEDGEKVSYAETKKIVKEYRKHKEHPSTIVEVDAQTQVLSPREKSISHALNQVNPQPEKELISPKQQILKVIPQQLEPRINSPLTSTQNPWHKLGVHWLFNGYPDSESFRKYLPQSISLTIAFPPSPEWSKDQLIPPQTRSISIFYSPFKDLDLFALKTMVRNAVELYTEENERIVFSFLPEPQLLLMVESLGCQCIIAEPEPQQCQRILSVWKSSGVAD